MRAIITGVSGFVGRYLAAHLLSEGVEVWGTTRSGSPDLRLDPRINLVKIDLSDEHEIMVWLERIRPDHIYHLAGQSSVKLSWEKKVETFEANVDKTIHLLEAVRKSALADSVRVLTVGSSEEYGKVQPHEMPIKEETPLRPISPYGISKATVSMLAKHYYNAYGVQVIHARPFNHIGPGQSLGFVTSDFAKQIVDIEKGLQEPIIRVGNLEAMRDFTDVIDIVRAYYLLVTGEMKGGIVNVCSSRPYKIMDVLNWYINHSFCNAITVENDSNRMRPSDIPLHYGCSKKIKGITSWNTTISIEKSLEDILNNWRQSLH